jgi:hypothetical protein
LAIVDLPITHRKTLSVLDPIRLAALFAAAFVGGSINSVAGGGTLVTFPSLLSAGVLPVAANATSTVALVPGSFSAFWNYRSEIDKSDHTLFWMGVPSVLGGILGALLVLKAGDSLFNLMVPYLILGATALFTAQMPIKRALSKLTVATNLGTPQNKGRLVAILVFQFFVALYGGFFGAGIGILMLAALGLMGVNNMHRMNALKNFAAVCINSVAAIIFIIQGKVDWPVALVMATGAIFGGYLGASAAKKIGEKNVRRIVIGIGVSIAAVMLIRRHLA